MRTHRSRRWRAARPAPLAPAVRGQPGLPSCVGPGRVAASWLDEARASWLVQPRLHGTCTPLPGPQLASQSGLVGPSSAAAPGAWVRRISLRLKSHTWAGGAGRQRVTSNFRAIHALCLRARPTCAAMHGVAVTRAGHFALARGGKPIGWALSGAHLDDPVAVHQLHSGVAQGAPRAAESCRQVVKLPGWRTSRACASSHLLCVLRAACHPQARTHGQGRPGSSVTHQVWRFDVMVDDGGLPLVQVQQAARAWGVGAWGSMGAMCGCTSGGHIPRGSPPGLSHPTAGATGGSPARRVKQHAEAALPGQLRGGLGVAGRLAQHILRGRGASGRTKKLRSECTSLGMGERGAGHRAMRAQGG